MPGLVVMHSFAAPSPSNVRIWGIESSEFPLKSLWSGRQTVAPGFLVTNWTFGIDKPEERATVSHANDCWLCNAHAAQVTVVYISLRLSRGGSNPPV